jgi:hypothetical protein
VGPRLVRGSMSWQMFGSERMRSFAPTAFDSRQGVLPAVWRRAGRGGPGVAGRSGEQVCVLLHCPIMYIVLTIGHDRPPVAGPNGTRDTRWPAPPGRETLGHQRKTWSHALAQAVRARTLATCRHRVPCSSPPQTRDPSAEAILTAG